MFPLPPPPPPPAKRLLMKGEALPGSGGGADGGWGGPPKHERGGGGGGGFRHCARRDPVMSEIHVQLSGILVTWVIFFSNYGKDPSVICSHP